MLIRQADVADEEAFRNDDRLNAVAEEAEWLVGHLDNPGDADQIAEEYLEGWGNAFYIRDPIGGGGKFTAYEHGKYGVERIASNGNRGGYHHVRNYILGHSSISTDPPESLPTGDLHD